MTTTAHANEHTVLDTVLQSQAAARAAEVEVLVGVLEWAMTHPPLDRADRCCFTIARTGRRDATEPLNAEEVPEVSAVAVAELSTALGLSSESGRRLVADVLELAQRLPGLWERVLDGRLLVWQARRIAQATHPLATLAARFVDRQLAVVAGRVGMAQVERLVAEAIARHDAALFVEQVRRTGDDRDFEVELDRTGLDGLVPVRGVLDLPDAIALDGAIAHTATELAALGSGETLAVRRARAVGDLAREHLTLWGADAPSGRVVVDTETGSITPVEQLQGPRPRCEQPDGDGVPGSRGDGSAAPHGRAAVPSSGPGPGSRGERPGDRDRWRASRRRLVLHVHLSEATMRGARGAGPLGRSDDDNRPITAETIRRWCGEPRTSVTVLPVLDLNEGIHHAAYEIPARLREQVVGRDVTCVYPGCRMPARSCDLDHIVPFDHDVPAWGGQTETANLAALCRRHHTLKTAGRISYLMTAPGVFEWTFPSGTRAQRDLHGTELLAGAEQRRAHRLPSTSPDATSAHPAGPDPTDPPEP